MEENPEWLSLRKMADSADESDKENNSVGTVIVLKTIDISILNGNQTINLTDSAEAGKDTENEESDRDAENEESEKDAETQESQKDAKKQESEKDAKKQESQKDAEKEENQKDAKKQEGKENNNNSKKGRKINRPTDYNYPQKCEFCGQVFLEKEMVRHKKAHPESFTLDCKPCGKLFHTKAGYDLHYNIHKIFHCVSCKKDFNARKHYRSHMERIHMSEGERPRIHECDICRKTFKDKFVLNTHKKTHFDIKAHKCPMCDYACNNLTYMKQHIMNHTKQCTFKCYICYRCFMTEPELQAHITKAHSDGPQIYKCDTCGKISKSKGNLRQHQKTHNPDYLQKKEHQCCECGKTFALKCLLKKHILSHKGQDKCHCKICGKLLTQSSYKKHLKVHSDERLFLCDFCGEAFRTNSLLMDHRRLHTGEEPHKPFSCDLCDKAFARHHLLLAHRQAHKSSECEVCGKSFSAPSLLIAHKKTHVNDNMFTCEVCGKGFDQDSLLEVHRNSCQARFAH